MRRGRSLLACACTAMLLGAPSSAQTPSSFEVASIKRALAEPGPMRTVTWQPGGQMRATGLTLRELIRSAYVQDGIQLPAQILGGPAWTDTQRFDVIAKADGAAGGEPTLDQRAVLLKTLLADRFALRVRAEAQRVPSYELMLADGAGRLGPLLTASTCTRTAEPAGRPCRPSRIVGMDPATGLTMAFEGMTMAEFAAALVGFPDIGRPIRDRTGLAGTFDLQLTLPAGSLPTAPGAPSRVGPTIDTGILTALQEQLGLKLEGGRSLVDVIVIDSAQLPTED